MEFLKNQSWDGSVDGFSRTSSKVSIIDEEDEVDEQEVEGATDVNNFGQLQVGNRQKGKQPQIWRESAPSSSRHDRVGQQDSSNSPLSPLCYQERLRV